MNILFGIAGLLVIVFISKDLVTTTLSFRGGGRVTEYLSRKIWLLFLKLAKGHGKSPILDHFGYILLIVIIVIWVISVWLGLYLLLLSDTASVLSSTNNALTSSWEKLYYAGYTLSTLGNGDYKAGSTFWQIVTNIFAFYGLALITISITYIMPVLSAVILQVKLSVFLNAIGDTPQQILLNCWNGKNFDRLLKMETDIGNSIIQHSQNHKAYPIIHYFHSCKTKESVIVNLSRLDEAISFLVHVVENEEKPTEKELSLIRGAQEFYLEVLKQNEKIDKADALPLPDWSELERAGILLNKARLQDFHANSELQNRRNVLTHLLLQDGWNWQEVYAVEQEAKPCVD